MQQSGRSRILTLGCALLACLASPAVSGHETGGARVTVEFAISGEFELVARLDPEHLPPELGDDPREIGVRLLADSALAFDGVPLDWERTTGDAVLQDGALRVVRRGLTPPGARQVTWTCRLPLGSSILVLHNAGDPQPARQWVPDEVPSIPFDLRHSPPAPSWHSVVLQYLWLGVTHIVPKGADHILFVLGLCLLACDWRPLIWQVSAFTAAHTLSLALSMFGVVSLSPSIVEPAIAISIVFIAVENVLVAELHSWRVAVVFGFGLLHGLGFAGVLTELGLPRGQFVPALLAFNAGVELGQLTVIAAAFLAVGIWTRSKPWYRHRVTIPASLAIALIGLYWAFDRVRETAILAGK